MNNKQFVDEFMSMRLGAELKALSSISLERELSTAEFERFKVLANLRLEGKI